jgi:hypothetical protein
MPTTTGKATEFITFSRGSLATLTDSDGYIKWAPHNLLLASEQFDSASWTKTDATVAANTEEAPNGTDTADTLTASGANGTALQSYTALAVPYVFSVWLKRKTGTGTIEIAADNGTYTAVTITSDWALYTVTQTPAAGSKSAGIRIVTSADEVYAWGASLTRADLGGMQANASAYPYYNPSTVKNLVGFTELLTTGWTNTNTTDTQVAVPAPNGSPNSIDVAATAGNGTLLASLALLASPYTFSIWLKRKTGTGTVEITVDGTTYAAVAVTSEWQRFSTTLTPSSGTKTPGLRIVTSGDAVYAWGAQLSDSASLDPYVPNFGAAPSAAAAHGPRLDYDPAVVGSARGLLVEEQRTNLITYSAQFDDAAWTKYSSLSVTANSTTSPDGTSNADTLIPPAATGSFGIGQTFLKAASAITYTLSGYAKSAGYNFLLLRIDDGSANGVKVAFNVSTGAVSTALATNGTGWAIGTASISAVGNSWYRWSVSFTTGTSVSLRFIAYVSDQTGDAFSTPSYTANGTSGIYAYGAQLEANASFATSYIPTAASTVTRSADVASVGVSQFPYSQSAGSFIVAFNSAKTNAGILGSGNTADGLLYASISDLKTWNGTTGLTSANTWTLNALTKAGIAYDSAGRSMTLNGGTIASDSNLIQTITSMEIGSSFQGGKLNGHIRQITYIPRRLSNAELQSRSS